MGDSRVVYLSGPINTGPRLIEHLRQGGADRDISVFKANQRDLSTTAKRLRDQRREIVVEPSSLNIPGWSQPNYISLWETFIERYVRLVIIMPGWQYSAGCALEFAGASEHNIATEALDGAPLHPVSALKALGDARTELQGDVAHSSIEALVRTIDSAMARISAVAP